MAQVIDGKATAKEMQAQMTKEVDELRAKGIHPGLAVILVGEDPASKTYVRNKERACERVGIYSEVYRVPPETTQEKILEMIETLNNKPDIHGILLQLPLPNHIDPKACLNAISPAKDVDGFHPVNVGRLMVGDKGFIPCTPHGIIVLLERTGIDIKGKEAVVVGRSNIVGKPVALLLTHRHATVTVCHTRTKDLKFHTSRADILVVAAGRPNAVTGDMVKEGAVVIDVGVNAVEGGLVGDVEFEAAAKRASAITPVPGGVGPMTITMLIRNTIDSAKGVVW